MIKLLPASVGLRFQMKASSGDFDEKLIKDLVVNGANIGSAIITEDKYEVMFRGRKVLDAHDLALEVMEFNFGDDTEEVEVEVVDELGNEQKKSKSKK